MAHVDKDTLGMIIDYEDGTLDEEGILDLFQHLIDIGVVWSLQGSYGRMATALIESGHCSPRGRVTFTKQESQRVLSLARRES